MPPAADGPVRNREGPRLPPATLYTKSGGLSKRFTRRPGSGRAHAGLPVRAGCGIERAMATGGGPQAQLSSQPAGNGPMSKKHPECPLYNPSNCKEYHNPKVCAFARKDRVCLKKNRKDPAEESNGKD